MNFNDTDKEELAKLGVRRHFRKPTGYEHYLRIGEVLNQRLTESQSFIDDATNPIVRFAWHQCFHPGAPMGPEIMGLELAAAISNAGGWESSHLPHQR